MSDSIRLRGKLGEEVDKRRKKELEPIVEMLKMPTTKESVEAFKKMGEKKKLGGKVKVKKLLPGGLLNKSIRMVIAAGQKAKGQKKLGEMSKSNEKLIETSKAIAQQTIGGLKDKLSSDVTKDLARNMARYEKTGKYAGILEKIKKDPRFSDQKENIEEGLDKLKDYGKKLLDQTKAIIDKDIQKPAMNKAGGFIDMTKDKNYYRGVI